MDLCHEWIHDDPQQYGRSDPFCGWYKHTGDKSDVWMRMAISGMRQSQEGTKVGRVSIGLSCEVENVMEKYASSGSIMLFGEVPDALRKVYIVAASVCRGQQYQRYSEDAGDLRALLKPWKLSRHLKNLPMMVHGHIDFRKYESWDGKWINETGFSA
jgi:hypothetical protein